MNKSLNFFALVLAGSLFGSFGALNVSAQSAVPEAREQVMLSFAPLVKNASPAVVNIFTRKAKQQRGPSSPLFNDPFFRRFFGGSFDQAQPRENVENSLGSGAVSYTHLTLPTIYSV